MVPEPVWPSESGPGVSACGDHRCGLRASYSPSGASRRLSTDAPRFLADHESVCSSDASARLCLSSLKLHQHI